MTLNDLNALDTAAAREAFTRCCGAKLFADGLLESRPFASKESLCAAASRVLATFREGDWKEAFLHHPKIGDVASLRAKFASTASWAAGEQAGAESASDAVLQGLAAGNDAYLAKFGFIFIVCATGKTASEMLALLNARLPSDAAAELAIAAGEQKKITKLRLEKLLTP